MQSEIVIVGGGAGGLERHAGHPPGKLVVPVLGHDNGFTFVYGPMTGLHAAARQLTAQES